MEDSLFKKNICYLLIAEFDIYNGSCLRHQYPSACGHDPQSLAELMLPDGAHNREEDWTYFFLNRKSREDLLLSQLATVTEESSLPNKKPTPSGQAMLFVFLPETKEWKLLSPSAVFIHYGDEGVRVTQDMDSKEFLIKIGASPELAIKELEPGFVSVMYEGVVLGFRFQSIAEETGFKDTLAHLTKFEPLGMDSASEEDAESEVAPFLYCINLVRTKKDAKAQRGANVKALTLCTRYKFIHIFKPIMILALEEYFKLKKDDTPPTKEEELQKIKEIFDSINNMNLSEMPVLSYYERLLAHRLDRPPVYTSFIPWEGKKIPVRVPTHMLHDDVGDTSIITLIKLFPHDIHTIMQAIVFEKRIIFLGYNEPVSSVCQCVLATVSLLAPPLLHVLSRAFPYVGLTDLPSFMDIPGYICGTTNPLFQQRTEWWDVLCDVSTGKVTVNPDLQLFLQQDPLVAPSVLEGDAVLMEQVEFGIRNHWPEDRIKELFKLYTQHLIDIAMGIEEFPDMATRQHHTNLFSFRAAGFAKTSAFSVYSQCIGYFARQRHIQAVDVNRLLKQLRVRTNLPEAEATGLFTALNAHIVYPNQIIEFLAALPPPQASPGGLDVIATALLHPDETCRLAAVKLLSRVEKVDEGKVVMQFLNPLLKSAYHRHLSLLPPEEL